jgi:hypothetical protein
MGVWVYARLKVLPTQTHISMWNRYIAYEVMDGNTSDKTALRQFLDKIENQYGKAQRV